MSVYSGFSTRTQESQYYKLVQDLLKILQSRVLISLKSLPRPTDNVWVEKFSQIYTSMKNLEFHKYLEPKLTESCRDLASTFSIDISLDPIYSDLSYSQMQPIKIANSIKGLNSPKKKPKDIKIRNRSFRNKEKSIRSGSQYYGKMMDGFLAAPETVKHTKNYKSRGLMETQDFWLLDDKIKLIESESYY